MIGDRKSEPAIRRFRGGQYDSASGQLVVGGRPVSLGRKSGRLLELLTREPGRFVTREECKSAIWGDVAIDLDDRLNQCMRQLRQALGDDARNPRFIQTAPGRGYRFIAAALENGYPSGFRVLRRAASVALVFLAALVSGNPTPPETPPGPGTADLPVMEELVQVRLLAARDDVSARDEAMRRYTRLLIERPGDPAILGEVAAVRARLALDGRSQDPMRELMAADRLASRALRINPASGEALLARGIVAQELRRDWTAAGAYYEAAVAAMPGSAEARLRLATYYARLGHFDKSREQGLRAAELAPGSDRFVVDLGWLAYYEQDFERAARLCRAGLAATPESYAAASCVVAVALQQSVNGVPVPAVVTMLEILSGEDRVMQTAEAVLASSGQSGFLRWAGNFVSNACNLGVSAIDAARLFAAAGDVDRGRSEFRRGIDARAFGHALAEIDPAAKLLRSGT